METLKTFNASTDVSFLKHIIANLASKFLCCFYFTFMNASMFFLVMIYHLIVQLCYNMSWPWTFYYGVSKVKKSVRF